MIRPNMIESIIIGAVQMILWLIYPWQTATRFETAMCLVSLGVIALCVLCAVEWAAGLFGKDVFADGDDK